MFVVGLARVLDLIIEVPTVWFWQVCWRLYTNEFLVSMLYKNWQTASHCKILMENHYKQIFLETAFKKRNREFLKRPIIGGDLHDLKYSWNNLKQVSRTSENINNILVVEEVDDRMKWKNHNSSRSYPKVVSKPKTKSWREKPDKCFEVMQGRNGAKFC